MNLTLATRPSARVARSTTGRAWPSILRKQAPRATSHSRSDPSLEAETMVRAAPLEEASASAVTPRSWSRSVATHSPRATSQMRIVLSSAVANQLLRHDIEQNNRTLFTLTLVTVLALPINIVAGFFGMNVGGIPLAEHPHGFWVLVDDEELLLPFDQFPWFRSATVEQLTTVERPSANHLYWPSLDVDLAVESIREPERFPLMAKN